MQSMNVHRILVTLAATVALCWILAGSTQAQDGTTVPAGSRDASLEAKLSELAAAHHGKVALYATQLNTGKVATLDADTVVQTASVIKLTLLFEAMEQVRSGKVHWDDPITLKPGDAVSGSVRSGSCAQR